MVSFGLAMNRIHVTATEMRHTLYRHEEEHKSRASGTRPNSINFLSKAASIGSPCAMHIANFIARLRDQRLKNRSSSVVTLSRYGYLDDNRKLQSRAVK